MRTQTITLKITYDENNYRPPEDWDWSGILDLAGDESAEMVDYSPITEEATA